MERLYGYTGNGFGVRMAQWAQKIKAQVQSGQSKILEWDGYGFWLCFKRLDTGGSTPTGTAVPPHKNIQRLRLNYGRWAKPSAFIKKHTKDPY